MDIETQGTATLFRLLLGVNAATLLAVIAFGYRVMRFINMMEFRVDLMWKDYAARMDVVYANGRDRDRDE